MHRSLPIALGAFLLALLGSAAPARADFNCEASALRATVATAPAIEPLTANAGAPACTAQSAGGGLPGPRLPVTGWLLWAGAEPTEDDGFFQPMHVGHLAEW